jgi:hypothetical protein
MRWLLDQLFGRRLRRDADRYLTDLARSSERASRRTATQLHAQLAAAPGPHVTLGVTSWDEPARVPVAELLGGHSLVTGGTGSGKTRFALLLVRALLEYSTNGVPSGFGVIDPKGDLYHGALYLIGKRLSELSKRDPAAAEDLRQRIVIYDFALRDPVSPYNILARWPATESDFFAATRADLLLDLLPGSDHLSLGGIGVLQKLILLLSECGLPITSVTDVLHDESLRRKLVASIRNRRLAGYFAQQFPSEPKATLAAIERRLEALFASEGVRLALAGDTAPDFRRCQDESRIVLVNCFGTSIARSVRRLLQGLVLSDVRQAVFARSCRDRRFLWICDEAQNFLLSEKMRDNMTDLLTMSRSFGSHFVCMTQNVSGALQDAKMLKTLYTNLRWSFSMRGEPGDCAFLKPVLPVTGRRARPHTDPFREPEFYSLAEERALVLDEIAALPDRVGYLWLKARSKEAVQVRTSELALPEGRELDEATQPVRGDATIGLRMPRDTYERAIASREERWQTEPKDLDAKFEAAYRRARGGKS